jgi:hypothetical protein
MEDNNTAFNWDIRTGRWSLLPTVGYRSQPASQPTSITRAHSNPSAAPYLIALLSGLLHDGDAAVRVLTDHGWR